AATARRRISTTIAAPTSTSPRGPRWRQGTGIRQRAAESERRARSRRPSHRVAGMAKPDAETSAAFRRIALHVGLLEHLAQLAEQFAIGVQGFAAIAFDARLARQLAQLLSIGARVRGEQVGQRIVALGDQALAPALDLMQPGGLAARPLAIVFERGADRVELG